MWYRQFDHFRYCGIKYLPISLSVNGTVFPIVLKIGIQLIQSILCRSLNDVNYFVCGYGQTCKTAWQAVYGISGKSLEEIFKTYLDGVVTFELQPHTQGQRHKTNVAKAWMRLFFGRIGDKMPDSLAINLPSYLDNRIIYGYLKDDLAQRKEQPICYSQFCRIMNKDFPDVFIPKVTLTVIKV